MKNLLFHIIALVSAIIFTSCSNSVGYVTINGYAQGGVYSVKANLAGVNVSPESLRDSVETILMNIDKSVSGYNKGSLLSRLNAGEAIVPDKILIELYRKSADIYKLTDGAVDVASAGLFDIWGFGFKNGEMPAPEQVIKMMEVSGMDRLVDDMENVLDADGVLYPENLLKKEIIASESGHVLPNLNFNAVAQGYTCDLVADYLKSLGIKDMMVDIGEIYCQGLNQDGKPWTLGIDRPTDGNNNPGADLQGIFKAPVEPCGIVTSGNYRKYYIRDGKKYAHTIDPRTGYPVEHQLLSATVVAENGFIADALATYCMVVGPEAAKKFILGSKNLEVCLISAGPDSENVWCSDGFVLDTL